ncbi:MAG: phenylacetic acid degradation protein PaaN [Cardiobacteriaceae bacterium]|nr:phenylacetic acid degradation protein PaaN [Cardiobacteriaceae bacterium]
MTLFSDAHRSRLERARQAARSRENWAAFAEVPSEKIYGEGSKARGEADFHALLGKPFAFAVPQENAEYADGERTSPYGLALNLSYPKLPAEALLARAEKAQKSWRKADVDTRLGLCSMMLDRLAEQSFLMANAVMHTTGQPFVMSFQAGAPHALDRALEALAYAADAMQASAFAVNWQKVTGKNKEGQNITTTLAKTFRTRGKGVGLVVGCATFPTWNGYPGLFASLVTGNSVIVKPAESAILPLAISVDIMRKVLADNGFDPDTVQLAVTGGDRAITQTLAKDARVKMIDYTGGPGFGRWLQENCPDTQLYLEQAGINNILIESTDNLRGMTANIAFSLSLFAGQMCTAPQNIYIPRAGIETENGALSFDDTAAAIAKGVEKLLADNDRAFALLGALGSDAVAKRVHDVAQNAGDTLLATEKADYAPYPNARTAKPLIIKTDAQDALAGEEQFGPIAFVIACDDADDALAKVCASIGQHGAMTTSLYSVHDAYREKAIDAIADAGSPLSVNLTGGVYVNQSAAYSDFHGSGLNPAANTSLTDLGFVSQRFGWVTVREQKD